MPVRGNAFFQDGVYHIYNRGEKVFLSDMDYNLCIRLSQDFARKLDIEIYAYCLMPNHYHFLVHQIGTSQVSKWIGNIFNYYVQAFNQKYNHKGSLFESRFKHIEVDQESYFISVCRYIHLNPVKAGLVTMPQDWRYSDYGEWIDGRKAILSQHFSNSRDYQEFVEETDVIQVPRRYHLDE